MEIKIINKSNNPLPKYETEGAAGMDLRANIDEPVTINPMERRLFPTGLYMEIPKGFELKVRPRSGLAFKHGITVLNSPGCIDPDYRGDIGVILINLGKEPYTINPGDRIAQGTIEKVEKVEFIEVTELSKTERGDGAFGHSGTN